MASKNMNYYFNVEYYKGLEYIYYIGQKGHEDEKKSDEAELEERDKIIQDFKFGSNPPAILEIFKRNDFNNKASFDLYTAYPGVMIGTGNPHEISMNNAIKCGFSFDYVTGLPYIPGSSIKGMLRSYFPQKGSTDESEKREYIKGLLENCGVSVVGNGEELIENLKQNLFEAGDVFFDAFPVIEKNSSSTLLAREYITPHKNKYKNPVPINLIKIKPGVKIRFMFILREFKFGDATITTEIKSDLLKQIILDMGVGAKTNVGFGIMTKNPPRSNEQVQQASVEHSTTQHRYNPNYARNTHQNGNRHGNQNSNRSNNWANTNR